MIDKRFWDALGTAFVVSSLGTMTGLIIFLAFYF